MNNKIKCFFKMIQKHLTIWIFVAICAIVTQPAKAAMPLTDIDAHWGKASIDRLYQAGAIAGYPDGSFRPNTPISAAEYVTLLARARAITQGASQTSHWAAEYMDAAMKKGWYDYDELPPTGESFDQPITRQLAVKILMNAYFPDVKGDYATWSAQITDWADIPGRYYDPILTAYETKIVSGEGGRFFPTRGLTRAEASALLCRAMDYENTSGKPKDDGQKPEIVSPTVPSPTKVRTEGVSKNGALKVVGTQLCNEAGEPIVLRGMSSHGIQWFGQFTSREAVKALADRGANLFRVAMYTAENGYLQNPAQIMQKTIQAIDAAIAEDLYVIIDWHILSDGDPMMHVKEAKIFWERIAKRYADNPAVLYEICNEPNGNISWTGNVKPYAEAVIPIIRAANPQSVILVGSPTWSQDIHQAAANPLAYKNIMYTCHFYAGTHTQWLRDRIDTVLKAGFPVFVTEWGTSDASGNGGPYAEETVRWLNFMKSRNISWANWSYADKNETSAALRPGVNLADGLQDYELSASGLLVFAAFS